MRDHPVSARVRARIRVIFTGVVAVAFGMLLPSVFVGVQAHAAAAPAADPCVGVINGSHDTTSLCVESSAEGSHTKPYDKPVIHKGDRISDFKWLINADTTGATDMTAVNVAVCLPASAQPNPPAQPGSPDEIYNGAGKGLKWTGSGTPASPWYTNPAGSFVVAPSGTSFVAPTNNVPYGPENCPWPSVHSVSGHSDVIATGTGTQAELSKLANLPAGKYLISVTADHYKIDGVHFVVDGNHTVTSVNEEAGAPFIVRMNPLPKKTATLRIHVFNDNASTNGQWDGQTETLVTCADATPQQRAANCGGKSDPNLVGDPNTDMSGFSVSIADLINPVTSDVFNNPLCTQYETDSNGNVILNADGTPNPIVYGDTVHATYDPTTGQPYPAGTNPSISTTSAIPSRGGRSGGVLAGTQSNCISDHYGDIVIPNLGPDRYGATVIPPDPRGHHGDQWVQTTTLEGGHDWDTWPIEGGSGYDTELIVGGERVTPVAHGFVKLTHSDQATADYTANLIKNGATSQKANASTDTWYQDASTGFSDPSNKVNKNGELKGTIMVGRSYVGSGPTTVTPNTVNVVPLAGTNLANSKADGPIDDGLISINCIATCSAPTDSAVWVGRARKDGTFDVKGLETGDYSVAFWDEQQNYILAVLQYHVTSSLPTPNIRSATRSGSNNNRTYTLGLSTDAGFNVGDYLTTTAGTNGWTGTFQVLTVSNRGRSLGVTKTSGNPIVQPTGTGSNVQAAPFIVSAQTGPNQLPHTSGNVPTVVFGRSPGLTVGSTVEFGTGSNGWTGNFLVTWVSADGLTVTLDAVNGANPTNTISATGTGLPTMNVTNAGDILLSGWFTDLQGSVYNDLNGNAKRDTEPVKAGECQTPGYAKVPAPPGGVVTECEEPGIPDFVLTERTRGNSQQDAAANTAKTNDEGTFDLSYSYPLGQFLIFEAYNTRYKNTGITYTTDNDGTITTSTVTGKKTFVPNEHTIKSAQVDYNFLPIIGLSAKVDIGVQAYGTGNNYWNGSNDTCTAASGVCDPAPKDENGAIVGTVTYDVTRNEFNPAYAVQEPYQPGISNIPVQLWKTKKTDGVHPDTYSVASGGSGAVQQWGQTATGAECLRPDNTRGTNAVAGVVKDAAGQRCMPFDYYVSENWTRPTGCQALDVNGKPMTNEQSLPPVADPNNIDYSHTDPLQHDCVEAPLNGFQIGGDGSVDGNFALTGLIHATTLSDAKATTGANLEQTYAAAQNNPAQADRLPAGDYVVETVNPTDTVNAGQTADPTNGGYTGAGATSAAPKTTGKSEDKKLYRYTDEGVVNVMTGDSYVPQEGFTGPDAGTSPYNLKLDSHQPQRSDANTIGAGTVASCAGTIHTVTNENPDFASHGGSPFLGQKTPICDAKVVKVVPGRSVNPGFFMYTDVPIPSKFFGLMNDDLNVNVDRRSILLGEVAPVSNGPVGVYDENGNWKYTAHTDVNGFYEVILPSMDTYSCPVPAGPCPNMYRLVGNDPGTLAHRNTDYNPQFRTIATEFQAWAGVVHPVDQAPTHQGITIEGPAAQFGALSLCKLADNNPSFFAIDKPYYDSTTNDSGRTYKIDGSGFGTHPTITFTLTKADGSPGNSQTFIPTTVSDTHLEFKVPSSVYGTPGPYQLSITNNTSNLSTVNALTFHVLGGTYLQHGDVYIVSPDAETDAGNTFTPQMDAWDPVTDTPAGFSGTSKPTPNLPNGHSVNGGRAIQRAVEAAYKASSGGTQPKLVVIYPNTAPNYAPHNAFASYFENVVLHGIVKLQGVGPGSTNNSSTIVNGTNIDASQFWSATQAVPAGANAQTSDGNYSDDWRTFANALPRYGAGPAELPEGEGVLAIAESETQYGTLFRTDGNGVKGPDDLNRNLPVFHPGVDGVLLTGGDQQGNPGNINTAPGAVGNGNIAPTPPGPAQGGAIMLDQYVRDFSITNNLIQSNGGSYGTVRVGTPDLGTTPDQQKNHNERLNVSNNRFVANGGTNLAGALGLFYGADKYTVKGNDFCGNFSAEYGGAISHYGSSPGGVIQNNRIYYNQGYDEGGGIMIAGNLPANNSSLSDGAGGTYYASPNGNGNPLPVLAGVTIDGNTLISNQSNDDGGGIRFLMAGQVSGTYPTGGVPFTVTNNIIANNLSTHEGGGVAIDDTPNVMFVNNTVVKNITTGTAATNAAVNGVKPQNPAGLSTGYNSSLLKDKLLQSGASLASALFSNPLMFNNIFEDNRAGWADGGLSPSATSATGTVHGIGAPGDMWLGQPVAPQIWDMGVVGGTSADALSPTYSVLSTPTTLSWATTGAPIAWGTPSDPTLGSTNPHNVISDIGPVKFLNPQDFQVDTLAWRNNTNTSFPVIVAHMVPVNLLADYHLQDSTSNAFNLGAASKAIPPSLGGGTFTAPSIDIDGQTRPALGGYDSGADELPAPPNSTDLQITKTDGVSIVSRGGALSYSIVVTNIGPNAATGATVTDNVPTALTNVTWRCSSGCAATGTGNNVSTQVNLAANGSQAVILVTGTVSRSTTATSLVNTATVAVPAGMVDTYTANNTATDTDTIQGVHIGNLNWTSVNTTAPANSWSASVTITVHDANHLPVNGATVSGTWFTLTGSGSGNCTTNSSGTCTVTRTGLSRTSAATASVTYYVTNLTHTPDGYQSALNHDPDAPPQAGYSVTVTLFPGVTIPLGFGITAGRP